MLNTGSLVFVDGRIDPDGIHVGFVGRVTVDCGDVVYVRPHAMTIGGEIVHVEGDEMEVESCRVHRVRE